MQVTAKIDYAVRAMLELAANEGRMTRDDLAEAQDIPPRYLETVLLDLRRAGIVEGQRGATGGYVLVGGAEDVTVADVARAVDGPLTLVQGRRPEQLEYEGSSVHLGQLWVGMRAALRAVMESVTIADLLAGRLPDEVRDLVDDPDAWTSR